jgi:hypothetical protein
MVSPVITEFQVSNALFNKKMWNLLKIDNCGGYIQVLGEYEQLGGDIQMTNAVSKER